MRDEQAFTHVRSLFHSFKYALLGIIYCIRNERNMRIHLTAALYVLFFSRFFALTPGQFAVLMLTVSMVVVCEMVNTSIEAIVNLVSPCYNRLAKIAKDVAAGAVLVCALASIGIGLAFFWKPDRWEALIGYFAANLPALLILLAVTGFAVLFIFLGPDRLFGTGQRPRK